MAQIDLGSVGTIEVDRDFSEPGKRREQRKKATKKRVAATPILHFLSTQATVSPFDINMAVDAGYKVVVPHINVGLDQTRPLVQDAIFSRPPDFGARTGVFIGGKDALLALDMLEAAKAALVPPFGLSAFADPGGSFTTAAAMVALVEHIYRLQTKRTLKGATVAVFGSTGVVGFASAVIAAQQGAKVLMVSHMGLDALTVPVAEAKRRFGVKLTPTLGARDSDKSKIVAKADIVLCAAAAGVRVITSEHLKASKRTLVVADVNAVPPSGIAEVELFDNGRRLSAKGAYAIGPLAIGDIKYKTQSGLLRQMLNGKGSVMLDFNSAFALARQLVKASHAK